ncbi:LysR family transcriptional regulator [Sphingorhabdus profundilacus]|nr:LysR family transcriptional regulator [Sphingorhabdus profundilacus]
MRWDDLNTFRTVASCKSLRQAAIMLSVSVNTVRSRVERLETNLGTTLLSRSHDGINLSEDGQTVLNITMEMQSSSSQLRSGVSNDLLVRPGELRICCCESLATFWLSPQIAELNNKLPDHVIMLHNEYNQNVIHSRDFDICIGYQMPKNPDAIVKKIATVHQILFASQEYIDQYGIPNSLDDAENHKIVLFEAPGLNYEASKLYIGEDLLQKIVKNKYNTSHSFFRSVINGAGIAVLPSYAKIISKKLVYLDLPIKFKFDVWLSFSKTSRNSRVVREAIDWAEKCFDSSIFPWFSDSFVNPNDFMSMKPDLDSVRKKFFMM